jgi:hypothetical protein
MLLKNLTERFANSVHSYWARLLSGKQAKFSNVFYRLSRNLNENSDTNLNWVYFIRTILNECGLRLSFKGEHSKT